MSDSTVRVPVIPALQSKINWTQVVSSLSMILVLLFGPKAGISPETQVTVAVVLGVGFDGLTWIFRTWFTKSVTASSTK